MTPSPQASQKPASPQAIGFLLLENFALFSLASAIEPLRMANQLAGRELNRWFTLSIDGEPISASDGLEVTPDAAITVPLALDMVIRAMRDTGADMQGKYKETSCGRRLAVNANEC